MLLEICELLDWPPFRCDRNWRRRFCSLFFKNTIQCVCILFAVFQRLISKGGLSVLVLGIVCTYAYAYARAHIHHDKSRHITHIRQTVAKCRHIDLIRVRIKTCAHSNRRQRRKYRINVLRCCSVQEYWVDHALEHSSHTTHTVVYVYRWAGVRYLLSSRIICVVRAAAYVLVSAW